MKFRLKSEFLKILDIDIQKYYIIRSWYTHHGLWNASQLHIYTIALYRSTCFLSGSEHNNLVVSKSGYKKNFQWVKTLYWLMSRVLFAVFVSKSENVEIFFGRVII